jgi:hypothetical protein
MSKRVIEGFEKIKKKVKELDLQLMILWEWKSGHYDYDWRQAIMSSIHSFADQIIKSDELKGISINYIEPFRYIQLEREANTSKFTEMNSADFLKSIKLSKKIMH